MMRPICDDDGKLRAVYSDDNELLWFDTLRNTCWISEFESREELIDYLREYFENDWYSVQPEIMIW